MDRRLALLVIGLGLSLMISCSSSKKAGGAEQSAKSGQTQGVKDGPSAMVYKTKKDYSENVPVMLSADGSKIVSYPSLKDVYYKGKLAYPSKLNDGYLLDNRGIAINVAFLSITYEKYSQLKSVPLLVELYEMIIDKDPLTELYNCGNRYRFKDEVKDLNQLIKGNLKECDCLKK